MATELELLELRRKISELDSTTYTDEYLGALIDESGDIDAVASNIWEEKAADYAELVDISEAGSSRKNGQLYKNALEMAQYFDGLSGGANQVAGVDFATTRAIVRPSS